MKYAGKFTALLGALVLAAPAAHAGVNSWTTSGPEGGNISTLAIHPSQPGILLATTSRGLYRTADGGVSWALIRTDFPQASVVFDPTDGNRAYLAYNGIHRSDDAGLTFSKLSINPPGFGVGLLRAASDGILFGHGNQYTLVRSSDHGASWTTLARPWPEQVRISTVTLDPNNAAVLYATVDYHGTYRSADRGDTWTGPIANSPGTDGTMHADEVFSFAVQPGTPSRLLASTNRGILMSTDTGTTWTTATPLTFAYWVGYDPFQPARAIALSLGGEVLRSADAGATWPLASRGVNLRMQSYIYGVFDPSTPNRLWAASIDGPLESHDWGDSFTWRTTGIRAGFGAAFSAADDGTIYAAFQAPRGVFRRDAGGGWVPVNNAAMYGALNHDIWLRSMAVEPGNSGSLYVLNNDFTVGRSLDGGATWLPPTYEFPLYSLQPISISIARSDNRVAYVATFDDGLWRTRDAGASWELRPTGLPKFTDVVSVDPADANVAYVAAGPDFPNAVYKTTNGGLLWEPTGTLPNTNINCISIDPSDSSIVYVCGGAELYKSTNGGGSWTAVNFGPRYGTFGNPRALMFDPEFPSTVFSAGLSGGTGFLRSVDGGATWETTFLPTLGQSEFASINKAVLNPLRPSMFIGEAMGFAVVEYEIASDLEVSIAGLGAPVGIGTTVQASVSIFNSGPYATSPADVRITLPAWLTPQTPANCTRTGSSLDCRVGALQLEATASIALSLTASATPSAGRVTAEVTGHEPDLATANNRVDTDVSSVRRADLELFMHPQLVVGRTAALVLRPTLTNRGPDVSVDTRVTFNVPAGLGIDAATISAGTCTTAARVITCLVGDLAPAATVEAALRLIGETHGHYAVTGAASSASTDVDTDQNASSDVEVAILADASVQVTEVTADAKLAGTPYQYNVVIRNDGPDPVGLAAWLRLENASATAASAPGGTCNADGSAAVCSYAAFPAGTSVTMVVTVNAPLAATVAAVGEVDINGYEVNAANNFAAMGTVVAAPPPPPPPPLPPPVTPPVTQPPAKKGGGGAFDWIAVMLLGSLLVRRVVVSG